MTTTADHQRRRALTTDELDTIHTAIDAATSTTTVLHTTISTLFTILLADTDRSWDTYTATEPLDPTRHAIPANQWRAIAAMATNRAAAWGTAAHLGLELANLMPSSYHDPDTPTPVLTLIDHRPATYQLQLSTTAIDTISTCETHIAALGDFYGLDSRIYQVALRSWHHAVISLLRADIGIGSHITADGPMNLYIATSSLDYGIIFHGTVRRCTIDGCHAVIDEHGTIRPGHTDADVSNHHHIPSYPIDAPQPGTWSVHS